MLAWRRLKYGFLTTSSGPQMEMFGIAREEVEAIIRGAGGRVLEARPDDSHGPDGNGFEYWVTKP